MRKFTGTLITILLFLLAMQPAAAQSNLASEPLAMLQIYYNAINRGDYAEAFTYQGTGQDFFDFVAGFEDTTRVQPYFGAFQPGASGSGFVPAVVSGYQSDGTVRSFAGCFALSLNASSAIWVIQSTTLTELPLSSEPSHSSIRAYLTTVNCPGANTNLPSVAAPVESEAAATIRAYFDAIGQQNYRAAYTLWLFPLPFPQPNGAPGTDYRPPFASFGAGYSATLSITLYNGAYQFFGASAGHSYRDGFLPVVLIGMDRTADFDTIRAFSGCYAMGRFVDGRMGILNARLQLLTEGMPTAVQIIDALNTDCITLGIEV